MIRRAGMPLLAGAIAHAIRASEIRSASATTQPPLRHVKSEPARAGGGVVVWSGAVTAASAST